LTRYERYVALGDSTSEGMDDPDGRGGYRGWANRLAERIAEAQGGGLLYANLAVRGRTTREIRDEQLAPALALRPDLATVVAGMNDLLRRQFDADSFARDLEAMQVALVDQGATVLTFTLPDVSQVLPFGRLLAPRLAEMNARITAACAHSGALLCAVADYPVASDPRLWSEDRLHANAIGHARIADALAFRLGVPDVGEAWGLPLPDPPRKRFSEAWRADIQWGRRHLLPWVWRHLRGRSSGDGRQAKRPHLLPVP
jgi:lysophospholipase L1-like esterase